MITLPKIPPFSEWELPTVKLPPRFLILLAGMGAFVGACTPSKREEVDAPKQPNVTSSTSTTLTPIINPSKMDDAIAAYDAADKAIKSLAESDNFKIDLTNIKIDRAGTNETGEKLKVVKEQYSMRVLGALQSALLDPMLSANLLNALKSNKIKTISIIPLDDFKPDLKKIFEELGKSGSEEMKETFKSGLDSLKSFEGDAYTLCMGTQNTGISIFFVFVDKNTIEDPAKGITCLHHEFCHIDLATRGVFFPGNYVMNERSAFAQSTQGLPRIIANLIPLLNEQSKQPGAISKEQVDTMISDLKGCLDKDIKTLDLYMHAR